MTQTGFDDFTDDSENSDETPENAKNCEVCGRLIPVGMFDTCSKCAKLDRIDPSNHFESDERGRIKYHAEHGNLSALLRVIGVDTRMNMVSLFGEAGVTEPVDLIDYYRNHGDFTDIEAVGAKSSDQIIHAFPLICEAIESNGNREKSIDFEGPASDEPIPQAERSRLFETHSGEVFDHRELPDNGISASDLTDWPHINRERAPPANEREHFEEMMSNIDDSSDSDEPEQIDETPAPDAVATDGGQTTDEPNELELPENETVRLVSTITGVMNSPEILEGETSSTGKTITAPVPHREDKSVRLDTEEILRGESEFRDSRGYKLYTPGRLRARQRSNHAPGPQAGANEVSDANDLPEPTHWPVTEQPEWAADECPKCGSTAPYDVMGETVARCEACGETIEKGDDRNDDQDDNSDEQPDKWDLSQYDRGDVFALDAYAGRWVVINQKRTQFGDVLALDVVNDDDDVMRLRKFDGTGGVRFHAKEGIIEGGQFREAGGRSVMVNVDEMDDVRDFDVIGTDEERLREWIRSEYSSDCRDDDDEDDDGGHRVMTDGGRDQLLLSKFDAGDVDDINLYLPEEDHNLEAKRDVENYAERVATGGWELCAVTRNRVNFWNPDGPGTYWIERKSAGWRGQSGGKEVKPSYTDDLQDALDKAGEWMADNPLDEDDTRE